MTSLPIYAKAIPWKKNKDIVLMGDFLVDLLNYEDGSDTADFLDKIYSTSLIPQITSRARIIPRSKTLFDNIFWTDANAETLSGNIVTNISDHLAHFLSFPLEETKKERGNIKRKRKYINETTKILMLYSLWVAFEILIGKKLLK